MPPLSFIAIPITLLLKFVASLSSLRLRLRRTLLGSMTLDESCSVTTPKSSSTAVAIAAADLSDMPYLSHALASVGSLRLFLIVAELGPAGELSSGTTSLNSSPLS